MKQSLLSKKELANRWNVSISTIDRRMRDGELRPSMRNPIRFNLEDVLKAEGTDNSKMSPFERRKLEREIKDLKEAVTELEEEKEEIKRWLLQMMAEIAPKLQS